MSRSPPAFIITLAVALLFTATLSTALASARDQTMMPLSHRIEAACGFLKSLYNPNLGLLRTTANSSVYYIASDNLLAQHALLECHRRASERISDNITWTIKCCSNGDDLMHEALLGDKIPLPIHTANILTIANSSIGTVFWEVHNATDTLPDCSYGDVTVYTALEYGSWYANATGLQHEMHCLNLMFDGKGIADLPFKDGSPSEHGIYQTYKLALYTYAQHKFGNDFEKEDLNQLLQMQGSNGGFYTGYDQAGTHASTQENAETTSIAILVLTSIIPPSCHVPHELHGPHLAWNCYLIGYDEAAEGGSLYSSIVL